MPDLFDALALARLLHEGVEDCAGRPYIEHPIWVMNALPPAATLEDQQIGLLHDTIEDCRVRLSALMFDEMQMSVAIDDIPAFLDFYRARGYSPYVTDGLRLVTRDFFPNLTYLDYVRQIANSGHRGAIWTKDGDNRHNSDPERVARVLPEFRERVLNSQRRYERSKAILKEAIDGFR